MSIETAISTLTQFHTSKEGIERFVDKVVGEVKGGYYNALTLKIYLKAIEKAIKQIDDETKDLSLQEAEKYGTTSFETMGATVQITPVKTEYDYSDCGHTAWEHLNKSIKELTEFKKEIETFLKTVKSPIRICNEDTGGEEIEIKPPVKKVTTGLKITI